MADVDEELESWEESTEEESEDNGDQEPEESECDGDTQDQEDGETDKEDTTTEVSKKPGSPEINSPFLMKTEIKDGALTLSFKIKSLRKVHRPRKHTGDPGLENLSFYGTYEFVGTLNNMKEDLTRTRKDFELLRYYLPNKLPGDLHKFSDTLASFARQIEELKESVYENQDEPIDRQGSSTEIGESSSILNPNPEQDPEESVAYNNSDVEGATTHSNSQISP